MRTSRLSRDTSKLLAATRTRPPSRPTRRAAVRDCSLNTVDAGRVAHGPEEVAESTGHGDGQSESDLSPVPEQSAENGQRTRKRKRGQAAPVAAHGPIVLKHEAKQEIKQETTETAIAAIASPQRHTQSRPKKARRVPAKKVKRPDGSITVEPPPNWEEIYALTREMRNENVAPVDTMGCESLADRKASPRTQRYQTLVSLQLSSQTKDTVTSVAIRNMQQNMPGGFCLESVLALDPVELNAFINKVGFHNLKTKYIKQTAEILRDKWNSDIPDTIEGLTSLPGVGPKMAYLCMSSAWGRDEGIGVDVHVHRITNLWGWHKTNKPEETRAALESWLPRDKWHDINNLLVGHGQTICLPVGRRCGECKLADRGLCPSAAVTKTAGIVKKQSAVVKNESAVVVKNACEITAQNDVKAEPGLEHMGMESAVGDIEDIGKVPRRAVPRRTSRKV